MVQHSTVSRLALGLMCFGFLSMGLGCGKKAVSSSGDEFAGAEDKTKASPVETIKPDRMATVPDEVRPPIEASRSQLDAGSSPAPSAPSAPPSTGGIATSPAGLAAPLAPSSSAPDAPSSFAPAAPSSFAPAAPSSFAPAAESGGLADIYFDFDQYTIRTDARPALAANAGWIKSSSAKSVLIEGHCDERGTEAYNLVLGEKRAKSTKRYLEDLGVSAARLKIVSYGKTRPFCKEHDENCYQLNRRAHFVAR